MRGHEAGRSTHSKQKKKAHQSHELETMEEVSGKRKDQPDHSLTEGDGAVDAEADAGTGSTSAKRSRNAPAPGECESPVHSVNPLRTTQHTAWHPAACGIIERVIFTTGCVVFQIRRPTCSSRRLSSPTTVRTARCRRRSSMRF